VSTTTLSFTPRHAPRKRLRADQDAYGQILLALFEGREAEEIMERDDGLVYSGDPSDYFAPYARWPSLDKKAMRYVRGRVLDVGCGAGRLALHLQERGHEVIAIDSSPLAVRVARKRGVRDARVVALADIDETLGIFDTVLVLRNNFGLVGGEAGARRLLRGLHELTSERARIITDSVDPKRDENPAWRTYRSPRGGKSRPLAQRFRVRWRTYATPWFHYLMFSPADMERLVENTGWHIHRLLEDGSSRFVAVLVKDAR
jgi:SAM-dependent methyltransferase